MTDLPIKRCPFCGSPAAHAVQLDIEQWSVMCDHCGVVGPMGAAKSAALERWNDRFSPVRLVDSRPSA